jgi:hypothetical protein
MEPKKYEGQHKDVVPERGRQTVVQIHKWLGDASLDQRRFFPVGEWSVAERVIVPRGEYVGRKQRVEVPYWRPTQESYVMAVDTNDKSKPQKKGIVVDYSPPEGDPMILVDFQGPRWEYTPAAAKVAVTEQAGTEVLLLSSDGKLLAHDSWSDRADPERTERLKKWHDRIKEVKDGNKDGGTGLFGPTGPKQERPSNN